MLHSPHLVVRLSLIFAVSVLAADTGTMTFRVRDDLTHFPIQAVIKGEGPTSFSLVTDAKGEGKVTLPEGEYRLEISARGYDPLRPSFVVRAGGITAAGGQLYSQVAPEEERPEAIDPLLRPGYTLLHEYVVDADTGDPIPGVKVRFVEAGVETETDGRGHFLLSVPTPRPKYPGGLGTDTLIYEKAGYKTLVLRNFGIGSDEMGPTAVDMLKGKGVIDKDATHKLLRE
jgi:hypothetical protein